MLYRLLYHAHTRRPPSLSCISVAVSKVGLCRASSKTSMDSIGGIPYILSQQMLAVIKHVVNDNIICLSETQLMHAPVHGARNTVQQLLRKTLNFISPELYGPNRPEVSSMND